MPQPTVVFALTGDVRRNSRALKQLRALTALGATVDVLTLGGSEPAGEAVPGIRIHVLPRPALRGARFFARVHRQFAQAARELRAQVYHASDLYALPAMHAAATRQAGNLVYDARELYTRVASTARRPWVTAFWRLVEGRYIRKADAVFTVSDSIARHLATMYSIRQPEVLHNVPPRQSVTSSGALGREDGAVVLLHQGQIQKHRGCFLLANAMREIHGAVLVFMGGGPLKSELQAYVDKEGLGDRIRFRDAVHPDELLPVTASADMGITLLEDTCLNHRFALPNKLFEYLMAGLPVLASNLPEIRQVVESFDVGCVVDPVNHNALASALQRVVDDVESRRRWASHTARVFETFSWETASQRFQDIYHNLLYE